MAAGRELHWKPRPISRFDQCSWKEGGGRGGWHELTYVYIYIHTYIYIHITYVYIDICLHIYVYVSK